MKYGLFWGGATPFSRRPTRSSAATSTARPSCCRPPPGRICRLAAGRYSPPARGPGGAARRHGAAGRLVVHHRPGRLCYNRAGGPALLPLPPVLPAAWHPASGAVPAKLFPRCAPGRGMGDPRLFQAGDGGPGGGRAHPAGPAPLVGRGAPAAAAAGIPGGCLRPKRLPPPGLAGPLPAGRAAGHGAKAAGQGCPPQAGGLVAGPAGGCARRRRPRGCSSTSTTTSGTQTILFGTRKI